MPGDRQTTAGGGDALLANRRFYNALWSQTRLAQPERFNTWPLIAGLLPVSAARLEIGPGLRPRLPIAGTHFVDISPPVIRRLNASGAVAQQGEATALPFEDSSFDLVCAFDVIEHVEDDLRAFSELSRVLKQEGILILSVPLHAALWSAFDDFVGHVRRYEPVDLTATLQRHRLVLEQSAVFGMQPANPRLLALGIWLLTHRRSGALFWYNWFFLPVRLLFQRRLNFRAGLIETGKAGEIVLVCRRGKGSRLPLC
ncbi:MAG: methyltransferase type 11 [Geobacteraceae bacterium GWC2_58_44]|nr:MAG: methyltransferase type 11 [Geobacteraceae bacterium GWC2_58_44]HBG05076.1 SAM-dependent methyltransferase [Geobacter sp.]